MKIKSIIKSFLKFQGIPLPFVGSVVSIAGFFVNAGWISTSFDIFGLLYDPIFLTLLGISSIIYINKFYHDKLTCNCHTGKRKRFHQLSGLVTGTFAAFTFYLIPVSFLFFVIFDSHSEDFVLGTNIDLFSIKVPIFVALGIFGFLARFITKDIFDSMDGHSGTLFNMKKSFPAQILEFITDFTILLKKFQSRI